VLNQQVKKNEKKKKNLQRMDKFPYAKGVYVKFKKKICWNCSKLSQSQAWCTGDNYDWNDFI